MNGTVQTPLPHGFEQMEIEAKLLVPHLRSFEELKGLHGSKLEGFWLYFRYEAMFLDTYYDTDDYDIFCKDGVLRARRRYRDALARIPRDARFQAKDAATNINAVFFRNEEQGPESENVDEWDTFLEGQLRPEAQDPAVEFIRNFAGIGAKQLKPVLEIRDIRFRLFLSKRYLLLYEMSLDRLQFAGLAGTRGSAFSYECEIESITEKTEENVRELIDLSEKVSNAFALDVSPESKYRRGIKAVVQ